MHCKCLLNILSAFSILLSTLLLIPRHSEARTEYIYFFSLTGYDRTHPFGKLSSFDVYKEEIYVSDRRQKTVSIFDLEGSLITRFGTERALGGRPEQIVVGHDKIFIRVYLKNSVEIFNILGNKIGEIPPPYPTFVPGIMAITEKGVLILDKAGKKVCFFDEKGSLLSSFSLKDKVGTVAGLDYKEKKVYISSMSSKRALSIYTRNGELIRGIGRVGNSSSEFAVPSGVEVDDKGIIWVVDAFKQRAVGYYPDGKKFSSITGQWTHIGSFNYPEIIKFGGGLIFVMETALNHITVLKSEKSPQRENKFAPF